MKTMLTAFLLGTSALATSATAEPVKNVVLVHGAFADETSWSPVAQILASKGYTVTRVANPLTSLADDVTATRAALDAQDGPAVLVGHSWGGVVIGEAGDHAKVAALVYVSAFAPDRGESLAALLEGAPPSPGVQAIRPDETGGLIFDHDAFPTLFAGDLPREVAEEMARHQLPSNPANFAAVAEVAAWHDRPVHYVLTTEDHVIPAPAQHFFAERTGATVTEIAASHSGLVSQAAAVAAVIEAAAQ